MELAKRQANVSTSSLEWGELYHRLCFVEATLASILERQAALEAKLRELAAPPNAPTSTLTECSGSVNTRTVLVPESKLDTRNSYAIDTNKKRRLDTASFPETEPDTTPSSASMDHVMHEMESTGQVGHLVGSPSTEHMDKGDDQTETCDQPPSATVVEDVFLSDIAAKTSGLIVSNEDSHLLEPVHLEDFEDEESIIKVAPVHGKMQSGLQGEFAVFFDKMKRPFQPKRSDSPALTANNSPQSKVKPIIWQNSPSASSRSEITSSPASKSLRLDPATDFPIRVVDRAGSSISIAEIEPKPILQRLSSSNSILDSNSMASTRKLTVGKRAEICGQFNMGSGSQCDEPCARVHKCVLCLGNHSLRLCTHLFTGWRDICVHWNTHMCKNRSCAFRHECFRCFSESHRSVTCPENEGAIAESKRDPALNQSDICLHFNMRQCTRDVCKKIHKCCICGEDHNLEICRHSNKKRLRLCCLFWNWDYCRDKQCAREHECLVCGSRSHNIWDCDKSE
ncbi:hypothetical protein BC830DRAFT_1134691, partial [Chytriomyces sp. MP71]